MFVKFLDKKAIFLDFFGTIVQEVYQLLDCVVDEFVRSGSLLQKDEMIRIWWDGIARRSDASFGDHFRKQKTFYGETLMDIERCAGVSVDIDSMVQKLIEFTVSAKPFEDSVRFLNECPLPCYILSNIDDHELSVMVQKNNLNVRGVITSEEARAYKPNPQIFRKGLEKFGYSVNDVLYVGDSFRNDYLGAKSVGIDAVWVNRLRQIVPDGVFATEDVYSVLKMI